MFCLNIALGSTSWRLLYREEEKARMAYIAASHFAPMNRVNLQDDFGQTFAGKCNDIHGVMLEDMDQTKMAHVEMALHQARTQSLATKMAQTDQTLKADSMARGPAIIAPMSGNGRAPF